MNNNTSDPTTAGLGDPPPHFSKQHWGTASLLLIASSFGSKALGVIRDILVAKFFGAGYVVDAFQVGLSVSQVLGAGTGIAAATAIVPHYLRISTSVGPHHAQRFATQISLIVGVCSLLASAFVAALPGLFVSAGAPNLPPATHDLAADLLRTLAFMIAGLNLVYLITALYHAHHHFRIPTLGDMLSQSAVVLSLCLFATSAGIHSLCWGMLAGSGLAILLQLVPLARSQFFQFGPPLLGAEIREFLASLLPILLCDYALHAQLVLQNFLSSGLNTGSIASLAYASSLRNAVVAIVATNVARGIFPALSQLVASGRQDELRNVVTKVIKYLVMLFVPISFFCCFNSVAIIRAMFMRGKFDESAVQSTALAFSIFSWGLLLNGLVPIFLRICYASGTYRAALASMVFGLICFFGVSHALIPRLGMVGIASASTISLIPIVIGTGFSVHRVVGGLRIGSLLTKLIISCLLAAVASSTCLWFRPVGLFSLLGAGSLFVALYLCLSLVFSKDDVVAVWRVISRKAIKNP